MSNKVDIREINDAVNAANDALYNLSNAEAILKDVKGWGIVDILGGKMIVTGIKRMKMMEADECLIIAQQSLYDLNEELYDIGEYFNLSSVNDGGLAIVDFMFDNIFTDVLTQTKINQALEKVRKAMAQVEGVLDALEEIGANLV